MSKARKKKNYTTTKNTIKKGADDSIIIEILNKPGINELKSDERKKMVIMLYNDHFGRVSKETKKCNLREAYVKINQKNRFITLLKQDGNKVDIIAAHYDELSDTIFITIAQQKGNSGSFNTSSEEKTIEKIFDLIESGDTYFFDMLPDELNPLKTNKKYKLDFIIGFVVACGEKEVTHDKGGVIKYLSGEDYLLYLGLEITTTELALQISKDEIILNHSYDAVSECCNFDQKYDECLKVLNYD